MKKKIIIIIAVGLLTALAVRSLVRPQAGFADKVVSCLLYPILKIQNSIVSWVRVHGARKASYEELEQQFQQLRTHCTQLQQENVVLAASLDFARDTAEIIEFRKRYDTTEARLAQIILRTLTELEQTCLVDAGSYHGITQDMIAICNNGLVGRVIQVYPFYSKLLLITDKRCKVAAYCSQTGAVGIHEGCNRIDQTAIHHVSHLEKMAPGDLVISSGSGAVFPRGFVVGTVQSWTTDDLSTTVTVQPFVNVQTIKYCYLINSNGVDESAMH